MELALHRKYHPDGTNGELFLKVCYTLELPWRENKRNISCIPEGRYRLARRYTKVRGDHLIVQQVAGRDGILLHPANDAQRDLRGCIAPVSRLLGPGRGSDSRKANDKLKALVLEALERNEDVWITIKQG